MTDPSLVDLAADILADSDVSHDDVCISPHYLARVETELADTRRALAAVQADNNVTLEQRRKAERDRELAQFACLELARELERTRAEVATMRPIVTAAREWQKSRDHVPIDKLSGREIDLFVAIANSDAGKQPRCQCTHEAGDSICEVHPGCDECGEPTPRPAKWCKEHAS